MTLKQLMRKTLINEMYKRGYIFANGVEKKYTESWFSTPDEELENIVDKILKEDSENIIYFKED
jgi:hypothetical protein